MLCRYLYGIGHHLPLFLHIPQIIFYVLIFSHDTVENVSFYNFFSPSLEHLQIPFLHVTLRIHEKSA